MTRRRSTTFPSGSRVRERRHLPATPEPPPVVHASAEHRYQLYPDQAKRRSGHKPVSAYAMLLFLPLLRYRTGESAAMTGSFATVPFLLTGFHLLFSRFETSFLPRYGGDAANCGPSLRGHRH